MTQRTKREVIEQATRNAVFQILEEEQLLEAKKKKPRKPLCRDHNPFHGKDGRFVNPEEESGSFSMKQAGGKEGCSWGKSSRKSNNRSRQSVKLGCGRGAKHRCKDGSPKWESLGKLVEDATISGDITQLEQYLSAVIKQAITQTLEKINKDKSNERQSACTFTDLLKIQNRYEKASKGKLKESLMPEYKSH